MNLGFETTGNATLVCHDGGPVLATDPWMMGQPYFGSWGLSHDIPEAVRQNILAAPFAWYSHGHPDHFDFDSLELFRGRTLLLGDHVGGRLADALMELGFAVRVLPDRCWVPLSERIKVQCVADHNQDSILLVDFSGRALVMNLNDAWDGTWRLHVRGIANGFRDSFLLRNTGYGDADMINFYTEEGVRRPPISTDQLLGKSIARSMERLGARSFIPFSSMHQFQRSDSVWANEYRAGLGDYGNGFTLASDRMLPAFVRYDVIKREFEELSPKANPLLIKAPEEFGDHWADELETSEVNEVQTYFSGIEHLGKHFDFIAVRVGGRDHSFRLGREGLGGITFEVPRASLMKAIRYEVFDDLLIGNFMKTTLHGMAAADGLYPNFTPYVGKYADNGHARSSQEVRSYLAAYRRRSPYEFLRNKVEQRAMGVFRPLLAQETPTRHLAAAAYRALSRKL